MAEWQFDHEPTAEEALASMETLRKQHGVEPHKYVAHVIAIPQNEKTLDENGRAVGGYTRVWKLYMQVAGRIAMLWDAAKVNDWQVSFIPDESGDGPDGLFLLDPKVYRETVIVRDKEGTILFSVPGTSKLKGGDFPYEKAETAARGRAIAGLGIGVLPGSGVSSAEEMNEVVNPTRGRSSESDDGLPETPEELVAKFHERREQLRLAKDMSVNDANSGLADYVQRHFDKKLTETDLGDGDVGLEWSELTPGELGLLIRQTEKALRELAADAKI